MRLKIDMATNIVITKDYRVTSFQFIDFTLGNKKNIFMEKFKEEHSGVRYVYNTIMNRNNKYNRIFREIYHERCAYCGISTQVIDSSRYEVDHVIPASVLKRETNEYTKEEINGINNLVCSCQMCNRGKQAFYCDKDNLDLLHPDNNRLPEIFKRSEDYYIIISEEYQENETIHEFYNRLKFSNQLRRLDFLLMEMKDFCNKYQDEPIIDDVQRLILKVESRRRRNY